MGSLAVIGFDPQSFAVILGDAHQPLDLHFGDAISIPRLHEDRAETFIMPFGLPSLTSFLPALAQTLLGSSISNFIIIVGAVLVLVDVVGIRGADGAEPVLSVDKFQVTWSNVHFYYI